MGRKAGMPTTRPPSVGDVGTLSTRPGTNNASLRIRDALEPLRACKEEPCCRLGWIERRAGADAVAKPTGATWHRVLRSLPTGDARMLGASALPCVSRKGRNLPKRLRPGSLSSFGCFWTVRARGKAKARLSESGES
ncbi:unnamed protein product [Symbiodinium natans]|uniref:Uncharacterized protein n=1 Tax=Symbiodinium natans TaxID=878477 RepID=A0A812V7I9_9DINO|nr:unnamed protein product [Symbiodinium natans]